MQDRTRKDQMKVGIFIMAGLGAVIFSVFFLGGEKKLFSKFVMLYGKLPHVQGLNPGSLVSLAGVPIGNVTEINFSEAGDGIIVSMKVNEKFLSQLRAGATLETRTMGALGDKFLYVQPGPLDAAVLKEGDFISASTQQDLMGIISEKGGEAGKIFDVIAETLKLVQTVNAENRIGSILTNLKDASANFKELSGSTKELLSELRSKDNDMIQSMKKMNSIMTKIDKGQGTLGALVNDSTLHDQLKKMLGGNQKKQYLQSIVQDSISEK